MFGQRCVCEDVDGCEGVFVTVKATKHLDWFWLKFAHRFHAQNLHRVAMEHRSHGLSFEIHGFVNQFKKWRWFYKIIYRTIHLKRLIIFENHHSKQTLVIYLRLIIILYSVPTPTSYNNSTTTYQRNSKYFLWTNYVIASKIVAYYLTLITFSMEIKLKIVRFTCLKIRKNSYVSFEW